MENKNKEFLATGELKISKIVKTIDEEMAERLFKVSLSVSRDTLQDIVASTGHRVEVRHMITINELPERNQNAKSSTK